MTRFDRWSKDNMPTPGSDEFRRIQRDIANTMKSIVTNAHIPTSASMIPDRQRAAETPRAPSGGTAPLTQAYIREVDAVAEGFARADRIAAIRQAVENAHIESHFEKGPRIEHDYNPISREQLEK